MFAALLFAYFLFQAPAVQPLIENGNFAEAEQLLRQHLAQHNDSAESHYLLGYVLFKQNNPRASLAEYEIGASLRPLGAIELEVIGCDYFLLEDYTNADEWLTRSYERNPRDPLTLYFLARTRYNLKHFDDAALLFRECLRLDPKNSKAQENLGLALQQQGNTEAALAAFRTAIDLHATPSALFSMGGLLLESNRAAEAVPYLEKCAALQNADAQTHRELGKAYLQTAQFERARIELQTSISLDPQSAPAHFLLAQVFKRLNMIAEARAETEAYATLTAGHSSTPDPIAEARALVEAGNFARAEQITRSYLALHKNSATAHYLLGYILFKQQKAEASLAEYTEGAKFHAPSALDFETIGANYVLLHAYSDADKWFTRSVEMNPANVEALYYLGRTKYNENLFEQAVASFRRCLQLDPTHVKAKDNLGLSHQALGEMAEAEAAFRSAISLENEDHPNEPGPFLNLGSLLVETGRTTEALPFLKRSLAISPQDANAHRALGKAYLRLNRLIESQAELERSAQLAPDGAPIHFMLAQVYRKLGYLDKAKSETDRYSSLVGGRSSAHQD